MNRQRLAQLLGLVAVVTVGGVTATIYAPAPGVTQADLADAGIASANRVATCPVRVDPTCAAQLGLRQYETVRFPVFRAVQSDGGLEFVLPPGIRGLGRCIEVLDDWRHCDIDATATFPAVASRWGQAVPLVVVRSTSRHVIPDCRDGGAWDDRLVVDCRMRQPDGGARWAGCNAMPRAQAVGTQCLDAPTGVVLQGERLEDAL